MVQTNIKGKEQGDYIVRYVSYTPMFKVQGVYSAVYGMQGKNLRLKY